jgi:hypothetical protein
MREAELAGASEEQIISLAKSLNDLEKQNV